MDESSPVVPRLRLQLIVLFAALVMAVPLYGGVAFMLVQGRKAPGAAPLVAVVLLYLLGLLNLAVAVWWFQLRAGTPPAKTPGATPANTLPEPGSFQQGLVGALMFGESCAIFGLVIVIFGGELLHFGILAGVSLVFDFAYLLPRMLGYFAALEKAQNAGDDPFA